MAVPRDIVPEEAPAVCRVIIVDNHGLVGSSLSSVFGLAGISSVVVPNESLSLEGILEIAHQLLSLGSPLLALVDLNLTPDLDGVDLVAPLVSMGAKVIVMTGITDRLRLAECAAAGAIGIFNKGKPLQELMEMIGVVAHGGSAIAIADKELLLQELRSYQRHSQEIHNKLASLTPKEALVLAKLQSGLLAEEIARESFVSLLTVRSQIHWILTKLNVHSQADAVALAKAAKWQPGEVSRAADTKRR